MTEHNPSEKRGHKELEPDGLPATGLVRSTQLHQPTGVLPIARSTFWAWVKAGRLQPVKLGPRVTAFRVEDVRKLFNQ